MSGSEETKPQPSRLERIAAAKKDVDVSHIAGNASDDIKRFVNPSLIYLSSKRGPTSFGAPITQRMKLSEVSIVKKAEEPTREEGRVVCLLTVEEDMLNGSGILHGGCSAFLVDICSTLADIALSLHTTGKPGWNVSQSISTIYHSPAKLGDELRIVNTTLTVGARAVSARTEIWNDTHHRLVVSGVHVKMAPSPPPDKSKL
ncbi:hypothetical protein QCA50_020804 [Cerrena zonata]|uniref:Thioesterase domain-containing protein n=1 Tax=Cerrena zonata TaxID=2478898 RepID=A0AAW0FHY7_9APHY